MIEKDSRPKAKVLILFGTRPEAIKLAPVIHELQRRSFLSRVVSSSQHTKLLEPFLESLSITVDHDLRVMRRNQDPNQVLSRVITKLDKVLDAENPDLIIVQGDTATALAGAMSGFNRKIPVAHVEAGLRSGNLVSPFPEEMYRRLISQIAAIHFAPTETNKLNLIAEGVSYDKVFVTGNTVVDSLNKILRQLKPSPAIEDLIRHTEGKRRILLTTHRRESFGRTLEANLNKIRDFVDKRDDVCVFFPVHPNPNVRKTATDILGGRDRIHLLPPLNYEDFLTLMKASWLIVSDSGGVQEEAPTLGKPLLVLRENTERPEAVQAGVARLAANDSLTPILEQAYAVNTWADSVKHAANPFGDGRSAARIVKLIEENFAGKRPTVRHKKVAPAAQTSKLVFPLDHIVPTSGPRI
jgi:UDP-N-acetylglucosamine 2-epimerase (non-hydrolysing)